MVKDRLSSISNISVLITFILLSVLLSISNESIAATISPMCSEDYVNNSTVINDAGNVILSVYVDTDCTFSSTRYEFYDAANSSSSVKACDKNSLIPDGLVIIAKGESLNCSKATASYAPTKTVTKVSGNSMTVCDGSVIPEGWFIIERFSGYANCSKYPSGGPAMRIQKATNSSYPIVCDAAELSLPAGYVITKKFSHGDCSYGPNISDLGPAMSIQIPSSTSLWVCEGSMPPAGYVYSQYDSSYADCAIGTGSSGPAWLLTKLQGNGSVIACNYDPSFIPTGWIITEKQQYSQCNGSIGYTIKLGQNNDIACASSTLPEGFVITERLNNQDCAHTSGASTHAFKIYLPDESTYNTPIFVCGGSDVPAGWVYNSSADSYNCSSTSGQSSLSFYILPLSSVSGAATVCIADGFTIPNNWIVTGINTSSYCSANALGSYQIEPARNGEVCHPTTVPDGYIISAFNGNYFSCNGFESRGFSILELTGTLEIACVSSPIPEGYGFNQGGTVSQCDDPRAGGQGFEVHLLNPEGDQICAGSPIPPQYVVTNIFKYTGCNSVDDLAYSIKVPAIGENTLACYAPTIGAIPEGLVVVESGLYTACSTDLMPRPGSIVAYPEDGLLICSGTAIPYGYVVTGTPVTNSNCVGGNAIRIEEIPVPKSPTEFINPEADVVPGSVPAVNYQCGSSISPFANYLNNANKNTANCP